VFLALFSSIAEGLPVDIVLSQDPPCSKGFLPSFSWFKSFAPPVVRPRVACYISQNLLKRFAVRRFFPPETDDFMSLNVFTSQRCFGKDFPRFAIGNAYARPLPPFPHSASPKSSLRDLEYQYLVAGNFNIHNAATDDSWLLSSYGERNSATYFDLVTDLGFTHLNTPGVYTLFPFTGTHRPSAFDLAFANPHMFPGSRSWEPLSLPLQGPTTPQFLSP